jgi:hypothetical protein
MGLGEKAEMQDIVQLCRSTHGNETSVEPHETMRGQMVTHLQLHQEHCSKKTIEASLSGVASRMAVFDP